MPLTAFSIRAQRELDLEQWLSLNGHAVQAESSLAEIPIPLRGLALEDIECSCCAARGVSLVRGARARGSGKPVGQGHYRFVKGDGTSAHHPLCDFFDEQKSRGDEYRVDFASDRTALTRAVRDLVCRGIAAGLFSQADMRGMRLWFHHEKIAHSHPLDVSDELVGWAIGMATVPSPLYRAGLAFQPEHGALPGFDWKRAAREEWAHRHRALFEAAGREFYLWSKSGPSALKLVSKHAGEAVLDPSALRDKYDATVELADFAANHLPHFGKRPAAVAHYPSTWDSAANALLALSALLLHVSDWDLPRAGALYCQLAIAPSTTTGLEGNLIGLNPFHDYPAWSFIAAARRVGAVRTDLRSVPEQLAQLQAEMYSRYAAWATAAGLVAVPASPRAPF